jgi:2-amino-4-hydroxy-6-hydroxymethyldihydropteridine diphosphokinase
MVRAAIALGSNLGDRLATLRRGASDLARYLSDLTVSDFIETAPEAVGEQPAFLNGAAVGGWNGDPRALLEVLVAIERACPRERPYPGAPRTLDLDLILFGESFINEPDFVVPHPRFRERGFVLAPLCQVAPELIDPVSGRTIAELYRSWRER